jgi:hypothetical protein
VPPRVYTLVAVAYVMPLVAVLVPYTALLEIHTPAIAKHPVERLNPLAAVVVPAPIIARAETVALVPVAFWKMRLVVVAFSSRALAAVRFVVVLLTDERFVVVAFVRVALVANKLLKDADTAFKILVKKFDVVAEVIVAFAPIAVRNEKLVAEVVASVVVPASEEVPVTVRVDSTPTVEFVT